MEAKSKLTQRVPRYTGAILAFILMSAAGLVQAATKITMPLVTGYYDDQKIYYVNTEASDQGVATNDGTTFVPKLTNSIGVGATADIYVVTNFSQHNIVDSVPNPIGPGNTNQDYSPLWRVTLVEWNAGTTPKTLTSEAAVLAARDAGLVNLTPTDIVVNCSVMVTPWGHLPSAIAVNIEEDDEAEVSTITLPLFTGFINGKSIYYINTDTSDAGIAQHDGINYVPRLIGTHASGSEADIFPFIGNANPAQHNVVDSTPTPVGPGNTDPQYSPLWDVVPVSFVNQARKNYPLVKSKDSIEALASKGILTVGPEANIIINCPIVRSVKK